MAITRIKNNQVTDGTLTNAKIATNTITGAKLAADLTYGSNLTITGNLSVNGTTTTIDSNNTSINDPLIALSRNTTGAPSFDAGILIERGTSVNAAWIFDETNDQWAAVFTTDDGSTNGSVVVQSYANIQVASVVSNGAGFGNLSLSGNTLSATNTNGDVIISPDGTGTVQIDSLNAIGGTIDGTAIGGIVASSGSFTTLAATGNTTVGGVLAVTGNTTVGGTLAVTGASTISTLSATDITASGTLAVTGTSTLGTVTATGTTVTTLAASSNATIGGTLSVTGMATLVAGADLTGDKIVNLADPTLAQDAATKAYVDTVSSTGFSLTDGVTTSTVSGGDTLTINGTTNEVDVAVAIVGITGNESITIGLPSDVTIGNNLTVVGTTSTATLTASGNATVTGTLTSGAATLASLGVTANTTVGGTLAVTGNTTVSTITSSGTATFDSESVLNNISVGGDATIAGDLSAAGGNLATSTALGVSTFALVGNTTITGDTAISGTLAAGNTTISGTLATGDTTISGTGSVSGDFSVATNKFNVAALTGDTLVAGTLGVTGNTTVSTIASTGLATLDSATITNNATVGGTLGAGATTVTTITSSGLATLASATVTAGATIGSTLSVGTDLSVVGNTALTGTLTAGATTVTSLTDSSLTAGRIVVAGVAGDLTDNANFTFDTITGALAVTGSAQIDNINVNGNTISSSDLNGNIVVAPNGTGKVIMSGAVIQQVGAPSLGTDAVNKDYVDNIASGGFTLTDGTTPTVISGGDILVVSGTANEVDVVTGVDSLTIGLPADVTVSNNMTVTNTLTVNGQTTINDNITITGNLTVQGATTTIESTISQVADPIMQIGTTGSVPTVDDGKDRGIAFDWFDTVARVGFFGYDNSAKKFTFIPDATIVSEVVSGTAGDFSLGSIALAGLTTSGVLTVDGTGTIVNDANNTWDGTTAAITGSVAITGDLSVDNVAISASSIITSSANSNLNITPNGTGSVVIAALDANGGSIDGTSIGSAVASTGAFTTLSSSAGTTVGTTLNVTGASTLSTVSATNITASGTTDVTGIATFADDVLMTGGVGIDLIIQDGAVIPSTTFTVASATGDTAISGTLGVTGAATLSDALTVTGATVLSDALTVTGATILNSTLAVTGGVSVNTNKFTVDATTGNTVIAGTASITGNTAITGTLTSGAATLASASITGNATVGGIFTVTGLATFTSGADMTGDKITNLLDPTLAQDAATKSYVDSVASGGWTASDGTNTTVISGGDTLTINGTVNETTVSVAAGLDSVTIGLPANVTVSNVLTVTGAATVGGTFAATGATTLSSTLSAGASTLASASITGAATVGATLDVTGITTLGDDVVMTGGAGIDLIIQDGQVTPSTTFSVNSASGDTVVGGTLSVTGAISGSSTLSAGASTLASATITGAVTVGTTLGVSGATTLSSTLSAGASTLASATITGAATVGTTLAVTGNTTVGGTASITGDLDSAGGNFSSSTTLGVSTFALVGDTAITGDLSATGTFSAAGITDTSLSAGRIVYTGVNGLLSSTATFLFDDVTSTLSVSGALSVDAVTINGNDITATGGSELTINEAGADFNFRVEGTSNANLIFVDAGQNNIGMGTATPNAEAILHLASTNSMIVPVGTTAQRPVTANTGMYRFNSTLGTQEIYDGTQWISGVQFTVISSDAFAGDDVTTIFTISQESTSSSAIVSINGVVQIPGSAYGISGTTLTFTSAPATGDNIDVRALTTTGSVTKMFGVGGTIDTESSTNGIEVTGALISKNAAVIGIGTTATNVDTFDGTKYRSAKYVVQVSNGTNFQTMEALVIHDGTVATVTEYAIVDTNGILGSLSANYNAGTIELKFTGVAVGNDVKVALPIYLEI